MTQYDADSNQPSPSLPPPPNPPPPPTAGAKPNGRKSRSCAVPMALLLILVGLGGVAIVLVVLLGAIGLTGLGRGAAPQQAYLEETIQEGSNRKVVIISVHGIITSMESFRHEPTSAALREQLRQAANDPDVVAVVLDMNTPGGEIVATDEVYHEIQRVREEHNLKVVTCMRSIAASGGYYLAAGTDWIVANRLTFTGSIGVIIGSYNISELLDKWGIETMVYKSGPKKDIMSMSRPPSQDEQVLLQEMIDEAFHEFAEIVAEGRSLPIEQVKDPAGRIGDGRVVSGETAKELGLVDQLGYLEDAIDKAKALAGATNARVVRYAPRPTFADIFRAVKGPEESIVSEMLPHYLPLLQKGRLYYLAPSTL